MSRPAGFIASSGLELLTFTTPNGHKASILLEELKEAYGGPDYVFQTINIHDQVQKESWFVEKCPNGRIPLLIDHDRGGLGIMESSAILNYLIRHFDPEHRFCFTEDPDLSLCEQWVAWQHSGLGAMQGQANHFFRLAKDRYPYPTQRFAGETERLYGVLDARLKDCDYLVGDRYSIADIASFCWVNIAHFSGIKLEPFPNVQRWWKRIAARPAVQKGLKIPIEAGLINEKFGARLEQVPEFKTMNDHLHDLQDKAKQEFGYKYTSP